MIVARFLEKRAFVVVLLKEPGFLGVGCLFGSISTGTRGFSFLVRVRLEISLLFVFAHPSYFLLCFAFAKHLFAIVFVFLNSQKFP